MRKTRFGSSSALALCLFSIAQSCLGQQLGAGIHPGGDINVITHALDTAGMSFRLDIHWSVVETEKGVLNLPATWDKFDALAKAAQQRGNPALLLLDYGNKFYGGGDGGTELPETPAAIQGFANYAKFMVNRFKGEVTQFEIYNEWNLNFTSVASPHAWGDPAAYVNLLKVVYPAIKAVNPSAVVVGGAVGGTDTNWINRFIQAGGLAYVDAVSIHPYVQKHAARPDAPSGLKLSWIPAAGAATAAAIPGTPEEAIAWIDQIKAKIDQAAPGRNIPFYVTEMGWSTYGLEYGISEAAAASYTERFMLMAHARRWISHVWWYELIDGGTDSTNIENRFGLLTTSGAAKPAFTSLQQISGVLQSTSIATQKTITNDAILVTGENVDGTGFACAWLPTNDFKLSSPSVEVKALINDGYVGKTSATTSTLTATPILLTK